MRRPSLAFVAGLIVMTGTRHEIGWLTQADQTMMTPAFVNYYLDMAEIDPAMVHFSGNTVRVQRPGLTIERPSVDMAHVQVFSAGPWSVLDSAKTAAEVAVAANIQAALSTGGHPELRVSVYR